MMRRICELLLAVLMFSVCRSTLIAAIIMVTASVAFSQESPEKNSSTAAPPAQAGEADRLPRLVSTMNGQARESGKLKAIKTNSSLQIVDATNGNPVGTVLVHEDEWQIECWRFSPDDKWLAVGVVSSDRTNRANRGRVYLWDVATGKRLKEFQEDDDHHAFGRVSDVSFAKSGDLFYFSPTPQAMAPLAVLGSWAVRGLLAGNVRAKSSRSRLAT